MFDFLAINVYIIVNNFSTEFFPQEHNVFLETTLDNPAIAKLCESQGVLYSLLAYLIKSVLRFCSNRIGYWHRLRKYGLGECQRIVNSYLFGVLKKMIAVSPGVKILIAHMLPEKFFEFVDMNSDRKTKEWQTEMAIVRPLLQASNGIDFRQKGV